MTKENCLIVHAAGRQLDFLRGEAFRIAKGNKIGWWTDRADVGTFALRMKSQGGFRDHLRQHWHPMQR